MTAPTHRNPNQPHFHRKGKMPTEHTLAVLRSARAALPFHDTRDFEECARGLIAKMEDKKVAADAGHDAWDMGRFDFIDDADTYDSIHPSLLRQAKLNKNYGLYKVVDGIYQVRGFDLSQMTFVRGKTGWIVIDPLITAETARAALQLLQRARRRQLADLGRDLFALPRRPLGRGPGRRRRESDVRAGKVRDHRAPRLHGQHRLRERLRR